MEYWKIKNHLLKNHHSNSPLFHYSAFFGVGYVL
jgi:hypothetical protein